MAAPDVKKLLELDLETRLALIQQLWDSVVAETNGGADLPVTDDERAMLDERLREDDEHPEAAVPWDELRRQLRSE